MKVSKLVLQKTGKCEEKNAKTYCHRSGYRKHELHDTKTHRKIQEQGLTSEYCNYKL